MDGEEEREETEIYSYVEKGLARMTAGRQKEDWSSSRRSICSCTEPRLTKGTGGCRNAGYTWKVFGCKTFRSSVLFCHPCSQYTSRSLLIYFNKTKNFSHNLTKAVLFVQLLSLLGR